MVWKRNGKKKEKRYYICCKQRHCKRKTIGVYSRIVLHRKFNTTDNTPPMPLNDAHLGGFSFFTMVKRIFQKIPLTILEQIELLEKRGLQVPDPKVANEYLNEISYYRLSAYFLPYQKTKNQFKEGLCFEQIIETYLFDRDLRLLVFDCIGRIEIAIRNQIMYQMAMHYGDSHWQENQSIFVSPYYNKIGNRIDPYSDLQSIMKKAKIARNPEVYIKHYLNSYDSPVNPPSWMCFELLTIGELSNIYRGLRSNEDKKRIANYFDIHSTVFTSWLHSLTYVRNICAHHSRLWNKELAICPDKLLNPKGKWVGESYHNNKRVFYFICILKYMLIRINSNNDLKDKLELLFEKYQKVPIKYMGIPTGENGEMLNWEKEPLWN